MANKEKLSISLPHHDISMYDATFLASMVAAGMAQKGSASTEDYLALLQNDPIQEELFVASLRIGYSTFFRNPLTFAALEQIVLPSLLSRPTNAGRREIRIWTAACAQGQEPYSIAMLLEELLEQTATPVGYRIFATDASSSQIETACTGLFADEALANVSLKRYNRWFTHQGAFATISPELRERIDFSVFDLLRSTTASPPSSIFGNFDLVFCCNILFYYNQDARTSILDKLSLSLGPESCLITGETERGWLRENGFREIIPHSAIWKLPLVNNNDDRWRSRILRAGDAEGADDGVSQFL